MLPFLMLMNFCQKSRNIWRIKNKNVATVEGATIHYICKCEKLAANVANILSHSDSRVHWRHIAYQEEK